MFELFDSNVIQHFVKIRKIFYISFLSFALVFFVLGLFFPTLLIFLILAALFSLCAIFFIGSWAINRKRYLHKLSITDKKFIVYDFRGRKMQELCISDIKKTIVDVIFFEEIRRHRKCLVLFKGEMPQNGIEYISYADCTEYVIIQNPELIEMINEIVN